LSLLHAPQFSSWVRGHLLCRVERVSDRFALTFDDGPSAGTTPAILDLLARRNARATFFLLAGNVRRRPDLVRRMAVEGHEPALHGDRHWPLPLSLPGTIRAEIRQSHAAIVEASGFAARHYRPPFGFMTPSQARFVRGMGFEPVLGDVYPEDAHQPGVERIVERVTRRLTGGSILILHDGSPLGEPDRSQTLAALEFILDHAQHHRWEAVTVAELLAAGAVAIE
jgi:peptidoglycan/xylan/chitin deacetylase (PgdA/CDA1 family)